MNGQLIDNIVYGPWNFQEESVSLKSTFIYKKMSEYLIFLDSQEKVLSRFCATFNSLQYICPDDCCNLQVNLRSMHVVIRRTCDLLGGDLFLPAQINKHRLILLAPLCYLDNKLPWLHRQIQIFSYECLDVCEETTRHQQIIGYELVEVSNSLRNFASETENLI